MIAGVFLSLFTHIHSILLQVISVILANRLAFSIFQLRSTDEAGVEQSADFSHPLCSDDEAKLNPQSF
jgi:hypothetical protein